jgi:prefoldin subunit 5
MSFVRVGVAIATITLLVACGDTADQDLCARFGDTASAVAELQELDPLNAKAEELQAKAENVEAELDQLGAVSEGRLDTAISILRASVDAVRQAALDDAGSDALETSRSQLEDILADLAQAWAVLEQRINVQCDVG